MIKMIKKINNIIYNFFIWVVKLNGKTELIEYDFFNKELDFYMSIIKNNNRINEFTIKNFENGLTYIEDKKKDIERDFMFVVKSTQMMSVVLTSIIFPVLIFELSKMVNVLKSITIDGALYTSLVIIGFNYIINEGFNLLIENRKIEMEYKYNICKKEYINLCEQYNKSILLTVMDIKQLNCTGQ